MASELGKRIPACPACSWSLICASGSTGHQRFPLARSLPDIKTFDGVKFVAQDSSWLMLRSSGTEPILRIYAETRSEAGVRKLLRLGTELTRRV